jgi:hypothetical protein
MTFPYLKTASYVPVNAAWTAQPRDQKNMLFAGKAISPVFHMQGLTMVRSRPYQAQRDRALFFSAAVP